MVVARLGSADDPEQFESIVQEYGAQQLHDELSKRRLNTSGRRPERVQRLVHAMVCDLTSNDQSPLGVDDLSTCSYDGHSDVEHGDLGVEQDGDSDVERDDTGEEQDGDSDGISRSWAER